MLEVNEMDYEVVPPLEGESPDSMYEILLKKEPWTGVRIRYGSVTVSVDEEAEMNGEDVEATLNFDYDVIAGESELVEDIENLDQYAGQILHHIILTSFETGDYRIGGDNNTDNHSEESASQ